jgi:hypothetical protein
VTAIRTRLFAASLLLAIGTAIAESNELREVPFSLVISASSNELKAGSDVRVKITITNTSTAPIGVEIGDVYPYTVIVRSADGNPSAETERGRKLKQKQRNSMDPGLARSQVGEGLEPGQAITDECVVSNFYDMTRPGQYSIQLERIWSRRLVPSNTITVRVVP